MNQLFSTLTTSSYDWSIDFKTKKDFIAVANEIGYTFTSSKTTNEVSDFIKRKVVSLLSSNECPYEDYITVFNQFSYDFYCNNKNPNEFRFLAYLRFFLNFLDGYTINEQKWIEAHKLIQHYIYMANHNHPYLSLNEKHKIISEAVKRFRKKGITVDVIEGKIHLSDDQFKKILQRIDFRAQKLGDKLYQDILARIKSCYRRKHDRFYLRKELHPTNSQPEPNIPFGYLYNLSIKNLNTVKNLKAKKQISEVIELSKDLMTILELQWLNPYESLLSGQDIIPYLRKNLLHDELFTVHQYSNSNARKIINGMFNKNYNAKIPKDIDLSIYIDIFDIVNTKPSIDIQFIEKVELYSNLLGRYTENDIQSALNELCIEESQVNKCYLNPFDINAKNYYEKPFIKNNEKIIYLNSYFHNDGFVWFLRAKLKHECAQKGIVGKKFNELRGDISEEFIKNLLNAKKISHKSGLKYKVKGNAFQDISSSSKDGECDFIIETDDRIIFIEEKSKELDIESKSGDILSGLWDLALSLLNSQEQICRHEYLLRKQGKIEFENGFTLELKDRKIEKVSLTLFDFYSLADVNSVRSILTSFINSTISSTDNDPKVTEKIEKINKTFRKLQNIYKSDIFKKEYINPDNSLNTLNSRFFSSNQLITMLDHCTGNEDFLSIMNKTKAVVNNSQDWFLIFNYFAIDLYKNKNK
ncbi:hypothetical protein ACYVLC_001622 [Vibrio cholerae]|uniref:hypothetical protein n=2 Tax=Vibrio cholerae TaxID=666 RepID=UPI000BA8DA76|nr:hypothetical protein [Vibrio cholerae]EJF7197209.1 hypothetical protein [Vibrio cholerae]EJL6683934.1 hypothetical protein [Vibrio cholerae]EJL6918104.1 hypothetical protein [Vibrio cholerae]EJL7019308.1 hypothetical protein [Vibrio cholerae]EKF9128161.1 hypothetical protein [Vibrio cholerae]